MKDLWSCYLRMAFWDGDNFCKAFAAALVNMSYHSWLRLIWQIHLCSCKSFAKIVPVPKNYISITWVHSGRQGKKGFSYISFVATQQCTVQINILCLKEFCIMSIFSLNHSFSCRIKPSNWWLPALSVESWCKSWVPDSLTSRDHSGFKFTILALKPNQSLGHCQKPIFKFWDIRKV